MRLPTLACLVATALAAPLVASSALAQEAQPAAAPTEQDWEIVRDPAKKALFVYIPVTTGLTLAVRCMDGALDGMIAGLPAYSSGRPTRPLSLSFGTEPLHETRWSVTTDRTVAISDYPAAFARSLRRGGPMKILIPGGAANGRNLRHDLNLPASSTAIEQVLNACNRQIEDPRDALLPDIEDNGLPAGITWERAPRPRYPNTNFSRGYVVTSCIAQVDGTLDQCQIESEQPPKSRFAPAVLRATEDARIRISDLPADAPMPRMIAFRTNFQMREF